MKIRPVKLKDIETHYLMELFRRRTPGDYEDIIIELRKRLNQITLKELLIKWHKEQNITLKGLLENSIAARMNSCELIDDYENYPKQVKEFCENVTSLDAICTLMKVNNEIIKSKMKNKYYDFLEEYLDLMNDEELYETEGDDTYLLEKSQSNIIIYPKRKLEEKETTTGKKAKVYQFKKIRRN